MKLLLITLFIIFPFLAWSQQDSALPPPVHHPAYERYSTIATLAAGFVDQYRNNYSLPSGFTKNNTSGSFPLYGKLEYGISREVSLAAALGYDALVYNFSQYYKGSTGALIRYKTDNLRIWSGGLTAYYHLGSLFHVRALDPFIGAGINLNNIRYSAYPQSDTAAVKLLHTVSLTLRAGARYYISPKCSLFGDIGYDKQSIFSLGLSCRFFSSHKKTVSLPDADGDGIPDKDDSCPHIKGLARYYGCPDTDGDGIPDNHDACPTVAGPADNHGCPYDTSRTAVIKMKEVAIPGNVIRFLPATAMLTDTAHIVLDSLVKVMQGDGKLDISLAPYTRAGDTQPVSKKTANARAVAIKQYLVDKGITPTRLIFLSKQKTEQDIPARKHRKIIHLQYDLTY